VETAIVKTASSRMAAELLPPAVAQEKIQVGARKAVQRLANGEAPQPLRLQTPITMAIDFVQSEMADKAALLPGARRAERRVEYSAADMVTIYAAFRTALALARG
jgi:D-amino peptidase